VIDAIGVIGNGVVGSRVVKRLQLAGSQHRVVSIDSRTTNLGASRLLDTVTVAVLAHPGNHHDAALELLHRGIDVITVGDQIDDVSAMMTIDVPDGTSLVIGAGMSPGLTGLIARHLATQLANVDEIHIAIHGTAGPACARQHHRALSGVAVAFDDGRLVETRAGTGKQLAWFPEPVGAYDCYRAEVPGPRVLHEVFPSASRVTVRVSANRRDRLTSRLPMLTPPHAEGGVGAVRVEVRGASETGARETVIAGVAEMVGTAAAATAAAYAEAALAGQLRRGIVLPGDERDDTVALLRAIERFGVRLQEFTGVPNG
jgi:hypothetical protein